MTCSITPKYPNGLQIKAKGLNITTITLKEFLKQLKY
jgi:hypothetical protein